MLATTLALDTLSRPHPSSDPFAMFNYIWMIGPIITVVVLGVVFATVILPLMRRSAERSRLMQIGEQAQAKILGLSDTGVKINNSPQIALQLEVYPKTRPPYQAQCVAIVSYLAIPRVQPGMMVPVRFDPADPSKIAVEV
ncbi:MAG TPA: DUF3592 domain-containing protein [Minicystis sp.]|nr:DUF3592 domain-containing protein [Minicystis sp.]